MDRKIIRDRLADHLADDVAAGTCEPGCMAAILQLFDEGRLGYDPKTGDCHVLEHCAGSA